MKKDNSKILEQLQSRLNKVEFREQPQNTGVVTSAGDGAITMSGLSDVSALEMLEMQRGQTALTLNLEHDKVVGIVLDDFSGVKVGDKATATGKLLSVGVGEALLGRVIDPLGAPIDGKGEIKTKERYPIEKVAPGVIFRKPVDTPVQTGIKAVDSMIPVGRGQRELIIGDRKTGKTAIALDTIINQKSQDMICIYVSIGQKTSSTALTIDILKKNKALDYTIIVAADAKDPAALQYIAPYTGCAIGEYFMDKGKDVLIVYDDLSKHAWAYREISLILKRPSGREAYPGDVFYLHSRLLERACKMDDEYGGGSITALPIIETQAGDLSAYIPTNVISITDGQIFFETDLFNAGIRPAINSGLSVSRVGGAAQTKAMKQVAGKLRLDLAQYRELQAFVQFSTDLDKETKARIDIGARMTQLLKQKQFNPYSVEKQVIVFWAGINGFLNEIEIEKITEFEEEYLGYMESMHSKILKTIAKTKKLDEKIEKELKKATEEFTNGYIKRD